MIIQELDINIYIQSWAFGIFLRDSVIFGIFEKWAIRFRYSVLKIGKRHSVTFGFGIRYFLKLVHSVISVISVFGNIVNYSVNSVK